MWSKSPANAMLMEWSLQDDNPRINKTCSSWTCACRSEWLGKHVNAILCLLLCMLTSKWAEQCFYSNKTSLTPFLFCVFWKSTVTQIKIQRDLSWEGNLPCQHSQGFEESSFHLEHQIWLFMGVTARWLHGKTTGDSLSSWVLSWSTCW